VRGQLQLLRHIYDATAQGSQFLVSTPSPILLAYPGAQIYEISENGPTKIDYAETNEYQLTKAFLDAPEAFFRYLFSDDETDVGD
jgi:predicted ATPase